MTQHLCQNPLKAPHASLTVIRCRMPASDRGRTKGAVVYHFIPSLLPSLHPPILCLPQRDTDPPLLQSGRCCMADLNLMAGRSECGWVFAEHKGCGGSESNKLCREAVFSLSLPFFLFSRAPGGLMPSSTCSPKMPLNFSWTILSYQEDYLPRVGTEADMLGTNKLSKHALCLPPDLTADF